MTEQKSEPRLHPAALDALRSSLHDATSWSQVRSNLTNHEDPQEMVPWRALAFAFGFVLIGSSRSEWRERERSPFGAMVEWQDGRFPPALEDVEEIDVDIWQEAFIAVGDDPVAASRLQDLLWERKAGEKPALHARGAIDAYVALSGNESWPAVERADFLGRAFELARRINDQPRQDQVANALVRLVEADLVDPDGGPGVTLIAIRALVEFPADPSEQLIMDLLERAEGRYGADPHIADTIADLRSRFLDTDSREQVHREQVDRWRHEAAKADGMLRMLWLEHARELAVSHGLGDLVDELTLELQNIAPEDLDLKRVSAEIHLPTDEVRAFVEHIVGADSVTVALQRFGAQPPPGGQPEALRSEVTEEMQRHPLLYLISKEVSGGPYGSSIFRAIDDETHRRLAVAERRALAGRLWSVFAADILDAIHEKYGVAARAELTAHFESAVVSPAIADRFARALELFWAGDYDESAHVIAPRIEAAIRDMARALGIPVIKLPDGPKTGGVLGLGTILHALRGRFADAGWQEYLENLLVDQLGLNLRNTVSHSLTPVIDRQDAALLLHAACFLANTAYTSSKARPRPRSMP